MTLESSPGMEPPGPEPISYGDDSKLSRGYFHTLFKKPGAAGTIIAIYLGHSGFDNSSNKEVLHYEHKAYQ